MQLPSDACSICQTHEDALDNLTGAQLLINQCGHKFCKRCSDRKFSQRSTFPCPICGSVVKRGTISEKTLDEIETMDDLKVRRRINDIYNKTESDFQSLLEYNNYQEEKEDVIFDLVHGINKEDVEARIKTYQKRNVDSIRTRLAQSSEDHRKMDEMIKQQKKDSEAAILEVQALDILSRKIDRELKRQEQQIRMGERTELSAELLSKQRELADRKKINEKPTKATTKATGTEKRSFSNFMSASATGLSKESDMADKGVPDGGNIQESNMPTATPKILEQFLFQRPPPKFIPSQMTNPSPTDLEYFQRRRIAGGFNGLTIHKRNYMETLNQVQLLAKDLSSVRWSLSFGNAS